MRSVKVFLGAGFLFLALVAAVRADIPGFGPKPRRSIGVLPDHARSVVIEVDDRAREPRLIVPKWLARLSRPAHSTTTHVGLHGQAPAVPFPVAIAFTLALAGTGVSLVRGGRVPVILLLAVVLSGAALGPPPRRRRPP